MPRLTEFDPRWIDTPDRKGVGFTMSCPARHCTGRIWCLFENPLDGGPPIAGDCITLMFDHYERTNDEQREGPILDRGCGRTRWRRTGDTFECLSTSPSLNMHECGNFTITNGGW